MGKIKEMQIRLDNEKWEIEQLNKMMKELEEDYESKRENILNEIEEHNRQINLILSSLGEVEDAEEKADATLHIV